MGGIVPAIGKISVAHETGGARTHEISQSKSSMPAISLVKKCEGESMGRPSQKRLACRSRVARIFMKQRVDRKAREALCRVARISIAVIAAESVCACPPFSRVSAGRIGHG